MLVRGTVSDNRHSANSLAMVLLSSVSVISFFSKPISGLHSAYEFA